MISYGNPNIFFANIGRGDVGIAPYNRTLNRNLKRSNDTERVRGSDGSAARCRVSDQSEWQRSVSEEAACRQRERRAPQQECNE